MKASRLSENSSESSIQSTSFPSVLVNQSIATNMFHPGDRAMMMADSHFGVLYSSTSISCTCSACCSCSYSSSLLPLMGSLCRTSSYVGTCTFYAFLGIPYCIGGGIRYKSSTIRAGYENFCIESLKFCIYSCPPILPLVIEDGLQDGLHFRTT